MRANSDQARHNQQKASAEDNHPIDQSGVPAPSNSSGGSGGGSGGASSSGVSAFSVKQIRAAEVGMNRSRFARIMRLKGGAKAKALEKFAADQRTAGGTDMDRKLTVLGVFVIQLLSGSEAAAAAASTVTWLDDQRWKRETIADAPEFDKEAKAWKDKHPVSRRKMRPLLGSELEKVVQARAEPVWQKLGVRFATGVLCAACPTAHHVPF